MYPIKFAEQNAELQKPRSMTDEECMPLPCHKTRDGEIISCWRLSWKERFKVLLNGRMWLGVLGGITQPPVWLDPHCPFERPKKRTVKVVEEAPAQA